MVVYSKITIQRIYDELKLRLREFINPFNFDEDTIIYNIIAATNSLIYLLIPFKIWGFIRSVFVTHRAILPNDYIESFRCYVNAPVNLQWQEARRVSLREWFQVTSPNYSNIWNRARIETPIYCIGPVRANLVQQRRLGIYIAPNTEFIGPGNTPPDIYNGWPLIGLLEYYAALPTNLTLNDVLPIPDEFQEPVILQTCIRFLSTVADPRLLESLHQKLYENKIMLVKKFYEIKKQQKKELDTFVEPITPLPFQPNPETELAKDLGQGSSEVAQR